LVRRITRKEIKQPDEFISMATQVVNFIGRNRSIFAAALLGILIAAGVVLLIIYQGNKKENTAQILLYQGLSDFRGPTLDLAAFGIQAPEKTETPEELKEKYKKAEAKFLEVIEKYPKTDAAWQARFYLANCRYQLGDSLAAIDSYDKILDEKKTKNMNLLAMINYNLGFLYENMGYMDRAIEYYRSVMEMGSNLYTQLIGEDLKRVQWKSEYLKQNRAQGMPGGPAGPNPTGPAPGAQSPGGIQFQLQPGAPPGQAHPGQAPPGKKPK